MAKTTPSKEKKKKDKSVKKKKKRKLDDTATTPKKKKVKVEKDSTAKKKKKKKVTKEVGHHCSQHILTYRLLVQIFIVGIKIQLFFSCLCRQYKLIWQQTEPQLQQSCWPAKHSDF